MAGLIHRCEQEGDCDAKQKPGEEMHGVYVLRAASTGEAAQHESGKHAEIAEAKKNARFARKIVATETHDTFSH